MASKKPTAPKKAPAKPAASKPARVGGTPAGAKRQATAKKATTAKRTAGRPSLFTPELADAICTAIESGDVSLRELCKKPGMPHRTTVNRWLDERPDFAAKYARARELQGDVVFEAMRDLEQRTLNRKVGHQAARVVLASMQWRADKLAPKRYGTRLNVESEGGLMVLVKDLTGRKD